MCEYQLYIVHVKLSIDANPYSKHDLHITVIKLMCES
jgi:hypothetical protein